MLDLSEFGPDGVRRHCLIGLWPAPATAPVKRPCFLCLAERREQVESARGGRLRVNNQPVCAAHHAQVVGYRARAARAERHPAEAAIQAAAATEQALARECVALATECHHRRMARITADWLSRGARA